MLHFKIHIIICLIYFIINHKVNGRPINEITETRAVPETQIPASFSESKNDDLIKPSEIQKAVCTVTSGDVRASAEAFTTRELKGVCGSTEMSKAFIDLEHKLTEELLNIKQMVIDLHRQLVVKSSEVQNVTEKLTETVTSAGISGVTQATFKFQPIPMENRPQKSNEISKNYYQMPKLKSLQPKDGTVINSAMREQEITKYNNTLITNKNVKVYTYYWRMENFTQNIKNGNSLSLESPIFSIRGKVFKIKAFFQHLHRDFLYLQLEDYSSSPQLSLGNSIILDTGGMFKEINSDNFKYKMSILDQSKKRSSDLVSQEFDNYDSGFLIPNSALIDSPFIKDDSLLIQIFLYLQ